MVFSASLDLGLSEEFLCFILMLYFSTLAIISVPAEESNTLKHYSTLNGYCDHHTCETALLWQKSHPGCVSCVRVSVYYLICNGMEVLIEERSPLL